MAASPLAVAEFRQSPLCLKGVPVLLYHQLSAAEEPRLPARKDKYQVSASQFHAHLELIWQRGCRVCLLRDFWSTAAHSDTSEPGVILTFDDGRASDYEVAYLNLLQKGARAEFFINTASIGRPGFLAWAQINEMHRAGMSFQSHGHDHVVLSLLPARELRRQLEMSKHILEDHLGSAAEFLAIPYGFSNHRVNQVAWDVGYRAVCDSWPRPARPGGHVVNRVAIYGQTKLGELDKLLRNNPLPYIARAARMSLAYLPKQILLRLWPSQLGVRVLEAQA